MGKHTIERSNDEKVIDYSFLSDTMLKEMLKKYCIIILSVFYIS